MRSESPPAQTHGYLIPVERIEAAILEIRGQRVVLARDLAALYGVSTKALSQVYNSATENTMRTDALKVPPLGSPPQ
jgi:hypothetical protein